MLTDDFGMVEMRTYICGFFISSDTMVEAALKQYVQICIVTTRILLSENGGKYKISYEASRVSKRNVDVKINV